MPFTPIVIDFAVSVNLMVFGVNRRKQRSGGFQRDQKRITLRTVLVRDGTGKSPPPRKTDSEVRRGVGGVEEMRGKKLGEEDKIGNLETDRTEMYDVRGRTCDALRVGVLRL